MKELTKQDIQYFIEAIAKATNSYHDFCKRIEANSYDHDDWRAKYMWKALNELESQLESIGEDMLCRILVDQE